MSLNPSTERALDRLLNKMSRPPRRKRGFSSAPIVLGLSLGLGIILAGQLVPRIWANLLPGGLDQARGFTGLPGLLFQLARICYTQTLPLFLAVGGIVLVGLVLCRLLGPLRWFFWLLNVVVIFLDAAILVVALRVAVSATSAAAGIAL